MSHDASSGLPRWGYAGAIGPDHWADLDSAYAAATEGRSQSPVDLGPAVQGESTDLVIDYSTTPLTLVDVGTTVEVEVDAGSGISYDGVRYELVQFHFHVPSEHSVDGHHAAAELHFVHHGADGSVAVLGVLADQSAVPGDVDRILQTLPPVGGSAPLDGSPWDLRALVPEESNRYAYRGSLTTPPCTEGVEWIVVAGRLTITVDTATMMLARYGANNRPVHPLHGRIVTLSS